MANIYKKQTVRLLMIILGMGLVFIAISKFAQPVSAASVVVFNSNSQFAGATTPTNSTCLFCHAKQGFPREMPSGEVLSLFIDEEHFGDSIHGNIPCTGCHTNIQSVPHPELTAQTIHDYSRQMVVVCKDCHQDQFNKTLDSVHMKSAEEGKTNAAVCTDCHNPHSQKAITDSEGTLLPEARLHIPETCAKCHNAIYEQYKKSIHGAALTQEGNTDAPTCIDCHGVHNIADPTTNEFRLNSPDLCAKCHGNSAIMDKYGISTQVKNTYVADFHGTTVTLFEKTSPDQETNKPVCFDCHGVHDIQRVDDPVYGLQMEQNILATCQRCHPNATANFSSAWMSHYIPSPEKYPIVYYVNQFYKFFIPGVLGVMGIFVISDIARRIVNRIKGVKHQ